MPVDEIANAIPLRSKLGVYVVWRFIFYIFKFVCDYEVIFQALILFPNILAATYNPFCENTIFVDEFELSKDFYIFGISPFR